MIEIRVGGYAPRDSTHSRAVEHFSRRLHELAGDAVSVDVLWNILDTGRPAADLLAMVEAGELTLCYFSSSYLGSRVPELNALEIPFLFGDLARRVGDQLQASRLRRLRRRDRKRQLAGFIGPPAENRLQPVVGVQKLVLDVHGYRSVIQRGRLDVKDVVGARVNFGRAGQDGAHEIGLQRLGHAAAAQGDALPMFWLGQFYERGEGVERDRERALHWYRESARRGRADAREALARLGR